MTNEASRAGRRGLLGAAALGATLAGARGALAQAGGVATRAPTAGAASPVTTRRIGRTGQTVTALGLGTFLTYDLKPGDRRDALREVLRRYLAGGGRLIDTSPLYGSAEVSVGGSVSAGAQPDGVR